MNKKEYSFEIGTTFARAGQVIISGWIDEDGPHKDRSLQSAITPERARTLAHGLMAQAELCEAQEKARE